VEAKYDSLLRAYVHTFQSNAPKAKLIWASTTTKSVQGNSGLRDSAADSTIVLRNSKAARIMAEENIPVNDLYAIADRNWNMKVDEFHWKPQVNRIFADSVVANLTRALKGWKPGTGTALSGAGPKAPKGGAAPAADGIGWHRGRDLRGRQAPAPLLSAPAGTETAP
jgi:hypothetical protein